MRASHGSLVYRLASGAGLFVRDRVEWVIARSSPNRPWFDAGEFSWTKALEARTPEIRRELFEVLRGPVPEFREVSIEQERISEGAPWKAFVFVLYGQSYEKNTRRCPVTTEALRGIPGMTSALFSILEPGARLEEHRGPYKGVLRYHLGLKVPEEPKQCGITVGGETRHWEVGQSLVFDDTFPHSAWNESRETRAVLFVDFKRELKGPIKALNDGLVWLFRVSPFVQNMFERLDAIDEKAGPGR
jgi:ornithine lipid ester-linked acyl 2-hydroxylase